MIPRILTEGDTVIVEAEDFHQAYRALRREGCALVSSEELARIRIAGEGKNRLSSNGVFTSEAWIYRPHTAGPTIVRESPVLRRSRKITDLDRKEKKLFLQPDFVATEGIVVPYDLDPIPTEDLAAHELTRFLFGSQAGAYGKLLRSNAIKLLYIAMYSQKFIDSLTAPIGEQNYINGLHNHSFIDGNAPYVSPYIYIMVCGRRK